MLRTASAAAASDAAVYSVEKCFFVAEEPPLGRVAAGHHSKCLPGRNLGNYLLKMSLVRVLVLVALVAVVAAQPCIECKDCKTNNCYSQCKPSCGIDINDCKKRGESYGVNIGKDACKTTQTYCGGSRTIGGPKPPVKVSFKQCQNIAYGTCQSKAKETASKGACVTSFNGFNQCNRQQFADFFYPEVNELCARAVMAIPK
ncbi:hypothetical protein OEZ85_006118 [Tetradesmus obliquus]|uniref:Uncharacterized protein n=1 Tax=Tetradesmus obliquus TaxID=3088 RepID=A0ABY8UGK0_TETOB|nr:hypothetical protein OEZ85_006118 [Tetradesmus obliquus]